jgi:excisionase family DNA binding protein
MSGIDQRPRLPSQPDCSDGLDRSDGLDGLGTDVLEGLAERIAELVVLTPFPPLLDAEAAARLLSVPKSWVLAEARAGRIPHVRLGKYPRFEAEQLQAWWRARAGGPVAGSHPVSGGRKTA